MPTGTAVLKPCHACPPSERAAWPAGRPRVLKRFRPQPALTYTVLHCSAPCTRAPADCLLWLVERERESVCVRQATTAVRIVLFFVPALLCSAVLCSALWLRSIPARQISFNNHVVSAHHRHYSVILPLYQHGSFLEVANAQKRQRSETAQSSFAHLTGSRRRSHRRPKTAGILRAACGIAKHVDQYC